MFFKIWCAYSVRASVVPLIEVLHEARLALTAFASKIFVLLDTVGAHCVRVSVVTSTDDLIFVELAVVVSSTSVFASSDKSIL